MTETTHIGTDPVGALSPAAATADANAAILARLDAMSAQMAVMAEQVALIGGQRRSQTDTVLRRCEQYLAGPDPQGRVRIYHQSFRELLDLKLSEFNTARIDHLYRDPHEKDVRLRMVYGDLNDSSSLNRILRDIKPDEIYNLGAQSHVKVSFEVPEYTGEIDALGATRILLDFLEDLHHFL